ncbi:polynucleotide kinase-phosphatase [Paludibaculum fermentans]|uniref:polynucleotide kinase-phosphatase n=1 Tax=Paludibaculum fermentans TaxID=1473598 RepID=UPI003EBD1829
MRILEIPELALVTLIGASGSGKSTFARQHFKPAEILSSDFFRGLVSNDENDQACSADAFDTLYYVLSKRLARGHLTVVDATNVRADDRKRLVEHARRYHCISVALVINTPERLCLERNSQRPDRDFGAHVVRRQIGDLKRGLRGLDREGFRYVHMIEPGEEIETRRAPLWNNRKHETGPFDIIGDVHGCASELRALLQQLGWQRYTLEAPEAPWGGESWSHPAGRKAVFLGDLVDRGPHIADTLRIVRNMCAAGHALCVPGNHDMKLVRWLKGKNVQIRHGLEQSIAELEAWTPADRAQLAAFLDGLVSHYVLDKGRLVVAHAGLREEMHGRGSGAVREFCLFGETTGETDEFGLPVRYNWAAEYRGKAAVVYGHTPVPEPEWLNNTINIDTGAVFGGKLTALRYPERELVAQPSAAQYAVPARPISPPVTQPRSSQQHLDDVLDLEDVTGKRVIETTLQRSVTIREENSIAALEVMSRFATEPRWIIYLPPTMSPAETSTLPDYLEYPTQAFDYFRRNAVQHVVCEEKHMGSRAVVVVCRDAASARERFGALDGRQGVCYTRTGRPFFSDAVDEAAFIARIQAALSTAGFWKEFNSSWFCLDCELMPWSAKARELIQRQFAPVGAAGVAALETAVEALRRSPAAAHFTEAYERRLRRVRQYRDAYRRYCWPVHSLSDYRLAPFHLLASEGAVHTDKTHRWHMQTLHRLAAADPGFLVATPFLEVDLHDEAAVAAATQWWETLTAQGGEGMVVKPLDYIAKGPKGVLQPAIKCRGREYLRIIYGPEYTAEDQLPRLRARALNGKRSLALRELALGIEALQRFTAREPLRRVHECVFGVLALESEPVDPRL